MSVNLYLTKAEASELRDALNELIARPERHHQHVPDEGYAREVTVAVYDPGNLEGFDEQSRNLIKSS